jgi:hypothetical protein
MCEFVGEYVEVFSRVCLTGLKSGKVKVVQTNHGSTVNRGKVSCTGCCKMAALSVKLGYYDQPKIRFHLKLLYFIAISEGEFFDSDSIGKTHLEESGEVLPYIFQDLYRHIIDRFEAIV